MNLVVLLGNLTRDPELRYLPSGSPVTNVGIAVNRKYKDKDGNPIEDTLFVDVEAFGKTAELLTRYCKKGRQVLIKGRLRLRTWEAQDGGKRRKHTVVCQQVTFLQRSKGEATPVEDSLPPDQDPAFVPDEEGVPF